MKVLDPKNPKFPFKDATNGVLGHKDAEKTQKVTIADVAADLAKKLVRPEQ